MQMAYLDYYPKEPHTLIIANRPDLVSWAGHEHAGKPMGPEDVADFNEFLKPLNIDVIDMKEANVRGISAASIIDFDKFREYVDLYNSNGLFACRIGLGIKPSDDFVINKNGWFSAEKLGITDFHKHNKIVINRTFRYRTNDFNWNLLKPFADNCVFVGSPAEHEDFCKVCFPVEYEDVKGKKALATKILGSKALVCNQSCIYWIAESLAHPRICETFYPRMGAYSNNYFNQLTPEVIERFIK
jgi:hypothetical protein